MKETIIENLKIITLDRQSNPIQKLLNSNIYDIKVDLLDNRKVKITFYIKRKLFNTKKTIMANEMNIKKPNSYKFGGLKGILDLTDSSFYIYYPNKEYKESENAKYFYEQYY